MNELFKAIFDALEVLFAALIEPDEKKKIAALKKGQKKLRAERDRRMGRT